jgi:hypothetical protein
MDFESNEDRTIVILHRHCFYLGRAFFDEIEIFPEERIDRRGRDRTVIDLDNLSTVLAVKAELTLLVDMKRHPAAILESGKVGPKYGHAITSDDSSVYLQKIFDHRRFELTLSTKLDVLEVTASALSKDRAWGRDSRRSRSLNRDQLSIHKALLVLLNRGRDTFARDSVGNEGLFAGDVFGRYDRTDTASAGGKGCNFHCKFSSWGGNVCHTTADGITACSTDQNAD